MKGMAKAILVGGFIVAAQAAFADGSGFPGSVDDAGVHLPSERHAMLSGTRQRSA